MSSFHMCGKVWSAPGNFSSAQSEGGSGCWAKLSPGWGCLPAGNGWNKCFGVLVLQKMDCLVSVYPSNPPKNGWWCFSDPALMVPLCPHSSRCDGRCFRGETLQGAEVMNSQAGEKHPNICPWVKDLEKEKNNNPTWISSSQALMFSSSATDTWVSQ